MRGKVKTTARKSDNMDLRKLETGEQHRMKRVSVKTKQCKKIEQGVVKGSDQE